MALLPGHDLPACAEMLASLGRTPALRLLPNVLVPELERLAAELVPDAELLAPTTSESRFAAYAGDADAVMCLDRSDVFDRRALIAAATGAAVATCGTGAAAAVLGAQHVLADETNLAATAGYLAERAAARTPWREAVLSQCDRGRVAEQLAGLVAIADTNATIVPRLSSLVSP